MLEFIFTKTKLEKSWNIVQTICCRILVSHDSLQSRILCWKILIECAGVAADEFKISEHYFKKKNQSTVRSPQKIQKESTTRLQRTYLDTLARSRILGPPLTDRHVGLHSTSCRVPWCHPRETMRVTNGRGHAGAR
jgi:hypothetical protein